MKKSLNDNHGVKFGFRIGQIFPITAYDFFPFKNFRADFTDFSHASNATIPLPGNGLDSFVMYRPQPRVMLRLGAHDTNANAQKSGFDRYDGEIFSILELGYDTGLLPRAPSGMPQGHLHLSPWHQDQREDADIDDGWGIAASAVQRFGRFTPFVRYGYADVRAGGPSSARHMMNLGLVTDNIFGQDKDRPEAVLLAGRVMLMKHKQRAWPLPAKPFVFLMAEGGGFEPPVACATTDFESVTFGRSDTPP